MADRASKRARHSAEGEGVDGNLTHPAPTASSTRPRRGTVNQPPPSAVIQRSSPEETRQSIHLTVKADPNKLRKAIGGNAPRTTPRTTVTRRNIVSGKRASRNSRVVREVDSDDEDEEEDEPEPMDVDDDDEDEEDEEVSDEDAEGEEDDEVDAEGEEDEEMDDLPPAPAPRIVVKSQERVPVNAVVNVKGLDAVEAKEISMLDDDEDDELSELDSDLEGDEEDGEGEDDDEDAEGEDDEEEVTIAHNGDDDEDMDSDDDGTPASEVLDPSKMTRRQRARMEEESDGGLMALSNEAQKKKHLTAEEHAMRRAEMARRRKNLSEKRNEEEKMDTINRLLKKQPPKRGKRAIQDDNSEEDGEVEKANPLYVRYTQTVHGTSMAVPEEWLGSPAGSVFAGNMAKPSLRPYGHRMVEEVA